MTDTAPRVPVTPAPTVPVTVPKAKATATITRNRRARAESTWDIALEDDEVSITGTVRAKSSDELDLERAGWRALDVANAIIDAIDMRADVTFEGLPPHPAAK